MSRTLRAALTQGFSTRTRALVVVAAMGIAALTQALPARAFNEPELQSTAPADGASVKSANVPTITADYDRELSATHSDAELRDRTGVLVAATVALDTDGDSIVITPAEALNEDASPFTAEFTALAVGEETAPAIHDPLDSTITFTVDDTAPALPVVTSPAAGTTTNGNPVHVLGTAEPNAQVLILEHAAGNIIASGVATATGTFDVEIPVSAWPAEENGVEHDYRVRAKDAATNISPVLFVNDVIHDSFVPTPSIDAPTTGLITSNTSLTVSGTAGEAGDVLILDDGVEVASTPSAVGPWSLTLSGLGDGEHAFTARLRDAAGNTSPDSNEVAVTIDTAAPTVPTIDVSPAPVTGANEILTVSGTAEPNSDIEILVDDENPGTTEITAATVADGTGAYSQGGIDVATLDDGSLVVLVTSTDAASNEQASSIIVSKDTTGPAAPSVAFDPSVVNSNNQTAVVIEGVGEPSATLEITVSTTGGATTLSDTGATDVNGDYSLSLDLSTLEDGTLTATVAPTDSLGNEGTTPGTGNATKDATLPVAPVIGSPTDNQILNSTSIPVSGSSDESGALVELTENGQPAGSATTAGDGTWSTTIAVVGDGAHTIEAVQTDVAGNVSDTAASRTFIVDTAAPSVISTSPVDGALESSVAQVTATYSETLKAGTGALAVRNQFGTLVAGTTNQSGATVTFTSPAALPESGSPYTATTSGTDVADTPSAVTEFSFDIDATPPVAPIITAPADGFATNDNNVVFTGTTEPDAEITLKDPVVETVATTTADAAGDWSVTAVLPDGTFEVSAIATDTAGNSGPESTPVTVDVDTTAPDAPAIDGPSDGALLNASAVDVGGTAEPGSTVTVNEGATQIGSVQAAEDGSWTVPATFADGSHTVDAIATDAAGNTGVASDAVTFTIDTVGPDAPAISTPAEGAVLSNGTVTVSGTAEPNADVRVLEGVDEIGVTTADGGGAWSVTPSAFADGAHTITATATDGAGNVSGSSAARTFTVDTVAPAVPVITSPTEGATLTTTSVTIGGTAEPGSSVTVMEGTTTIGSGVADGTGAWSVSGTFADGAHLVNATATDVAGNVGPTSTNRRFVVDLAPPAAPTIVSPAEGQDVTTTTVTITGTAEAGSTVRVFEGTTQKGITAANAAGNWIVNAPFTAGAHTITATATDAAGNTSAASAPRSFTVTPDTTPPAAPVITDPVSGVTLGPVITIRGTAEAHSQVTVREGTSVVGNASAGPSGNWQLSATFGTGMHTIAATARDAAGNVGPASEAVTFEVDASRPTVEITTADGSVFGPTDPFTIAGTATDNKGVAGVTVDYFNVLQTKVATVAAAVEPAGAAEVTWTATAGGLLPGRYTVQVTSIDANGNRSGIRTASFVVLSVS